MYVIASVTLLCFAILWAVSRKKTVEGKGIRPILRMAAWIYESVSGIPEGNILRGKIVTNLEKLHPGKEVKYLLTQYYVEKWSLVLTVIFVGTVLGVMVFLQGESKRLLQDERTVERGSYKDPDREMVLEAEVEGYPEQIFQLDISGMVPDKETVDQLEQEFWEKLKEEALLDNLSWDLVCTDLLLQERLGGYPFVVEWISDSPSVIDNEGNVKLLSRGEEEKVALTAKVVYYEWEWVHTVDIKVISRTEDEELLHQELAQLLEMQESASRQQKDMQLPAMWQDKEIKWKEKVENHGVTLWILALTASAMLFFLKDRDLEAQLKKRQKLLKDAYPGIVHKLELYLGAGLTVRGALGQMAEAYLCQKQAGKGEHPAYEEILCVCRELSLGNEETKVYERLGIRCGSQEYVRLGALLAQYVVKGGSDLQSRLAEEASASMKEQIQQSRKLGEEASTKLLVPMVMMLGIVMVMIMIPAFGTF